MIRFIFGSLIRGRSRREYEARPSASGSWRVLFLFLAVGIGIGFYTAKAPEKEEPVSIVPLLTSIKQLGDLHSVRYNMHDIVEHERKLEPTGIFRALPGAAEVYGAVTRNTVLLKAEGGVEAGVDLTQVGPQNVTRVATQDGVKYRVRLPHAKLYTPEVNVDVVRKREGYFWRDANLVPEATRKAQQRFLAAAERTPILQDAEKNAVATLTSMVGLAGGASVEFYF